MHTPPMYSMAAFLLLATARAVASPTPSDSITFHAPTGPLDTCTNTTLSWTFSPTANTDHFTLVVTGVDPPSEHALPQSIEAGDGSCAWEVKVPQGTYTLSGRSDTDVLAFVASEPFMVTQGHDTTCLQASDIVLPSSSSSTAPAAATATTTPVSNKSGKLAPGAIAGILVGVSIATIALGVYVFVRCRHRPGEPPADTMSLSARSLLRSPTPQLLTRSRPISLVAADLEPQKLQSVLRGMK